jgi:hypothetical protein
MNPLEKQLLWALGVALFIRYALGPSIADNRTSTFSGDDPSQSAVTWSGAGTDPFGVGYTVTGKATRGGL